jgi:EAL domain-containing protein (putative c-di-GMP-specific phosphodiesterase class I)
VETADQLRFLRKERCDTVQGYYLHRPLPEAEVAGVLKLNRMRRDSVVPVYA